MKGRRVIKPDPALERRIQELLKDPEFCRSLKEAENATAEGRVTSLDELLEEEGR